MDADAPVKGVEQIGIGEDSPRDPPELVNFSSDEEVSITAKARSIAEEVFAETGHEARLEAEQNVFDLQSKVMQHKELIVQLKTVNRELNKLNHIKDETGSVEIRERAEAAETRCLEIQAQLHKSEEASGKLQMQANKVESLEVQLSTEKTRADVAESTVSDLQTRIRDQRENVAQSRTQALTAEAQSLKLLKEVEKDIVQIGSLKGELDRLKASTNEDKAAFDKQTFDLSIEVTNKNDTITKLRRELQRKDEGIQNLTNANGKLLGEREKRQHLETRFREELRRAAAAEKRVAQLQAQATEKDGVISGLQTVYWGDREEWCKKPRVGSSMKPDTSAPVWKKQPHLDILAEHDGTVEKETDAVPPDQQVRGEWVGCEEAVPPPGLDAEETREALFTTDTSIQTRQMKRQRAKSMRLPGRV
jgi:ribosomal protein L29